jgi:membrane-associated phospholipid phosphatase
MSDSMFGPVGAMDGAGFVEDTFDTLGGGGSCGSSDNPLRPTGVVPETTRRPNEPWFRGHPWPPTSLPGANWPTVPVPIIGPQDLTAWSPMNHSLTVLAEFVQVPDAGGNPAWINLLDPAVPADSPPITPAVLAAEVAELRQLVAFRSGAMAEAMAQRGGLIGYFRGVLSFSPETHPNTYYLCAAALRIGQFQCMHYKQVFRRPRPGRVIPGLMPPIDAPGHPAYPSGHATESHLIAMCLEAVVPAAISGGLPNIQQGPLRRIAERMSKVREVLGLHYPSDTAAGVTLAQRTFPIMQACPTVVQLTAQAQLEW